MDPQSKTLDEWRLIIAITEAESDNREAPWYGPWDLVLRNFLFSSFCKPPHFTITYPQFPVSKHVDVDDANDDDDGDEDSGQLSQHPSRSAAPSPETFRGSPSSLLSTPPKVPQHSPPSAPPQPLKKRTTRIPDFVQMLYKIVTNRNGTIFTPITHSNRIILLVEIKKSTFDPTPADFADIFRQTDHQSRHAFHTSPATDTLGTIIAIGPWWTYVEYHRNDLRPSPSLSEKKDPTYSDGTPPPPKLFWKEYPRFAAHLASVGCWCLCLETKESNEGILVIRKRLRELNNL